MITVSPLSGYKFITPFTITINPSATNAVVNWGDGNFSNTSTATHIYSASDKYSVFVGNCSSTSAFSLSVFDGGFFSNKITVAYDVASAIASCLRCQ